jgi:hypothetical protein
MVSKKNREQLRKERQEAEGRAREAARRRLWAGYGVAGLLAAAVVAGIVVVLASGGGSSSDSGGAFGPHYQGLEQRRVAAKASTMGQPASATHIHPHLAVFVDGEQVEVPANIGIDPNLSPTAMAGLHTHDASGTIHDEGMPPGATLGQFFEIWGVPFSQTELGPHRAGGAQVVRMWVDGQPSHAFGNLRLEDGQQIVVAYGPRSAPPPSAVSGGG